MEQIIVTHKDGSTIKLQSRENASTITRCSQSVELLGADTVDISVESAKKLIFQIGDKINIIGRDYTLNTPPVEKKLGANHFTYDLQFEGVQYDLSRATYSVNVDTTSNAIQDLNGDSLTGNLKRFLDVLISNANRVFPGRWVLGAYPVDTETKTESFGEADNCLSVLQSLCSEDKYNTEFNISIGLDGVRTLNIGATGTHHAYTFEYGRGKGIYDLTRQKVSSSNIITRLNVFGSSRNINTSKYRAFKLCLPGKTKGQSYLEDAAGVAAYGIWENTKTFEEVYPRFGATGAGAITALGANELTFVDANMDFDLNAKDAQGNTLHLIAGTSAKIHFNTGNLAGFEFEVSSYNHTTKQFTILPQTDENGYTFPSKTSAAFQFAAGDKYVLLDIYMPQSYINAAEAELAAKGQEYLSKYCQPRVQYGLTLDRFFLRDIVGAEAESNIIWAGDYIPVRDTDLEVDKTIRVKGFTRDLLSPYAYSLTISDLSHNVSIISRVVNDIRGLENVVRFNNLNDPARARRNYLAAQEVLNMIFDPEGDFYTDKIKPLSIDTTMLSVGAKSMQFGLAGVIMQPNYLATKNRVVYSAGTLTHYTILDSNNNPRTWNIAAGDVTLATDAAYYIYARCEKAAAGGVILFSTEKILPDSGTSYYHFLIGIINSVDVNNVRAISLMYGFSTMNGRFIKTGRIQSADGSTFFDLDTGEIRGALKFTSGVSVEQAIQDQQIYIEYSANGTSWHTTFTTGDLFMRQKKGSGAWSAAIRIVGETGAPGNEGRYTDYQFAKNTSTTTAPTTGWQDAPPAIVEGEFVWMRTGEVVPPATSPASWSAATRITGDKGADGRSVTGTDVEFAQTTSATVAPTSGWQTTAPAWENGKYIWTRTKTTYSTGDPTYSAAVNLTGAQGGTGTGVESMTEEYYLSTSKTIQEGGSWTTTPPTWVSGKYMWTRVKIVYKNPASTVYTTPVVSSEWEAVNEVQVGGRNLIIGSEDGKGWTPGTYQGDGVFQITRSTGGDDSGFILTPVNTKVKIPGGVKITISFEAKSTGNLKTGDLYVLPLGWQTIGHYGVKVEYTSDWTKYVYTNITPSGWGAYADPKASPSLRFDHDGSLDGNPATLYIRKVKLELGNKPTDWTPAPEDVQAEIDAAKAKAAEADYLKAALQGSTDITGGLLATNVLLMKSLAGAITGGISGLSNDNVGMWTGGTYEEAIASLAKIIFRKDGSGQLAGGKILWNILGDLNVGDLYVEANGALCIKDANKVNRAILTRNDITTLASIENTTQNITINNNSNENTTTGTSSFDFPNQIVVNNNNSEVTVVTTLYTSVSQRYSGDYGQTYVSLSIVNLGTGNVIELESVNCFLFEQTSNSQSISVNKEVLLGIGTYCLRVTYDHISFIGCNFRSLVEVSATTIFFDGSSQRTEIGKNGIGVIGNATNYAFFGIENGTFKVVVRGTIDIPAGLGGGSISSSGGVASYWGKITAPGKIVKSGSNYTITHNIGDTDYSIILTPKSTSVPYFLDANRQANTIVVTCGGGFDFVLIRTK